MAVAGFASPKNIAPLHQRYVGLYHYSHYWRQWDKIIEVNPNRGGWVVQAVADQSGDLWVEPEFIRAHSTPLHADMFADFPFNVTMQHIAQCKG